MNDRSAKSRTGGRTSSSKMQKISKILVLWYIEKKEYFSYYICIYVQTSYNGAFSTFSGRKRFLSLLRSIKVQSKWRIFRQNDKSFEKIRILEVRWGSAKIAQRFGSVVHYIKLNIVCEPQCENDGNFALTHFRQIFRESFHKRSY